MICFCILVFCFLYSDSGVQGAKPLGLFRPSSGRGLRGNHLGSTRNESPIFVRTHDFACWLLARTIKFPKSQRFVMAKRVEETVLDFQERLIRAARADNRAQGKELREADVLLEILRRHIRTCVELKLFTVRQYEYAAGQMVEIGRLLGGWIKKPKGSTRREPVVGTGP